MHRQSSLALLATGVFALHGLAQATESVVHNDMDGDGRSDIVWRNARSGSIVYWSAGDIAKSTRVLVSMPAAFPLSRMMPVATGAFGDIAKGSLLLQDPVDAMVYNVYPTGAGYTAYAPGWCCGLNSPVRLAAVGDFDGDTYGDLVYRDPTNGANWFFSSVNWYGMSALPTVSNAAWSVAGVGDFDGDGFSDLLWRNLTTGQNAIWRSANSALPRQIVAVSDVRWTIASVADFDGDGRADIFWRNSLTGANVLWPSANFAARRPVVGVTGQHWQVAASGDFNGDHRADVFWRNNATGANVIWYAANFNTQSTLASVNMDWSVQK